MDLTIELFILITSNGQFIGVYDTLDEAERAANEDNGGYIPHSQEVYSNSSDRNAEKIPLYQNFSRHDIEPSYYVLRHRKSVLIVPTMQAARREEG